MPVNLKDLYISTQSGLTNGKVRVSVVTPIQNDLHQRLTNLPLAESEASLPLQQAAVLTDAINKTHGIYNFKHELTKPAKKLPPAFNHLVIQSYYYMLTEVTKGTEQDIQDFVNNLASAKDKLADHVIRKSNVFVEECSFPFTEFSADSIPGTPTPTRSRAGSMSSTASGAHQDEYVEVAGAAPAPGSPVAMRSRAGSISSVASGAHQDEYVEVAGAAPGSPVAMRSRAGSISSTASGSSLGSYFALAGAGGFAPVGQHHSRTMSQSSIAAGLRLPSPATGSITGAFPENNPDNLAGGFYNPYTEEVISRMSGRVFAASGEAASSYDITVSKPYPVAADKVYIRGKLVNTLGFATEQAAADDNTLIGYFTQGDRAISLKENPEGQLLFGRMPINTYLPASLDKKLITTISGYIIYYYAKHILIGRWRPDIRSGANLELIGFSFLDSRTPTKPAKQVIHYAVSPNGSTLLVILDDSTLYKIALSDLLFERKGSAILAHRLNEAKNQLAYSQFEDVALLDDAANTVVMLYHSNGRRFKKATRKLRIFSNNIVKDVELPPTFTSQTQERDISLSPVDANHFIINSGNYLQLMKIQNNVTKAIVTPLELVPAMNIGNPITECCVVNGGAIIVAHEDNSVSNISALFPTLARSRANSNSSQDSNASGSLPSVDAGVS